MSVRSRLEQHRTLFQRMTAALGIDLEERAQAGRFPPEDEAVLVQRCAGCLAPEACAGLLAGGDALATPPAYCENAARLMAMRDDGGGSDAPAR